MGVTETAAVETATAARATEAVARARAAAVMGSVEAGKEAKMETVGVVAVAALTGECTQFHF